MAAKVLVYDVTNLYTPSVATWWSLTTATSRGVTVATTAVNGGDPGTIERIFITADLLAWGAWRAAEHGVQGTGALDAVAAFGLDDLAAGAAEAGIVAES